MTKSKIKKNPYAQFYLNQVEMLEQQRQYWLKHPKEFVKSLTFFIVTARNNLSIEDKMKLEKVLEG